MPAPHAVIALLALVLSLSACDNNAPTPPPVSSPAPSNPTQPAPSGAAAGSEANPAVPAAASVFPPSSDAQSGPTPTDGTRKPTQAERDLPVPGQNNDHSAPLSPAH